MPPKRMRGGGKGYIPGVEINGISKFSPLDIPGVVLWIKADPANIVSSSIEQYAQNQSPSISAMILEQYQTNLTQQVIAEIKSAATNEANSLMRLELVSDPATGFPNFVTQPGNLDVFTLDKCKLATNKPVSVSADFSSWIISTNAKIEYVGLIDKIVVSPIDSENPASFSEIVVFATRLTDNQAKQMDGYIAYRKNEQYLLDIGNPYLPPIEYLSFLASTTKQIHETETSLEQELEIFDSSVNEYKKILPNAAVLNSAPNLRQRAAAALSQISDLKKNITKAGLLSRKKGTETVDSVFQSAADLQLYAPPLTQDIFNKKLADYSGVLQELQAYVKSIGNADEASATATTEAATKDQEMQILTAQNNEELQFTQIQKQMRTVYQDLRNRSNVMNADGANQNDVLLKDFINQIKAMADAFDYYFQDVKTRWTTLSATFAEIDGSSLPESTDPYLNKLHTLYEQIEYQMNHGDFAYVKGEIFYWAEAMAVFYKRLKDNKFPHTSKKTITTYFRSKYRRLESYVNHFDTTYTVISDATTTLANIIKWNKDNKKPAPLDKSFPIPIVNVYQNSIGKRYIREVNKYDNSFTGIEYVITNPDGTVELEENEIQMVFPSLENLHRHEQDMFFKKASPFLDASGNPIYQIYNILEPYKKTASILDLIPEPQVMARSFYHISDLQELPRDSANTICEITLETPQPPILLPRYALATGSIFICVNAGKIALQIQVPGLPEDMIDTLGPSEVCVYNYLGSSVTNKSFYGRYWWNPVHVAYDTLYDTPRSSMCSKITEFSKCVYMRTATDPLFDKDGFLVEAKPDSSGNVYDTDDVYFANPYSILQGDERHLSDLKIHPEWDEKMIIKDNAESLYVVTESSTGLAVFCSSSGIAAANEFGFCKYVLTPMFHIKDSIRTRGASAEPITIQLNPAAEIVQYCNIPVTLTFDAVFRSSFVRPIVINNENQCVFINSAGDPIVSPLGNYIQVENVFFRPPYSVGYIDGDTKEQAYIPNSLIQIPPLSATFPIFPYKTIDVADKRIRFMTITTGNLLIYRYKMNLKYIQSCLATIETKYDYCRTLQFVETRSNLALLQKSYTEIEGFMNQYKTYETNVSDIKTQQVVFSKGNSLKIAIDTLEVNIKQVIENVFTSFVRASNAIVFFTRVAEKLELLKKSVIALRETVFVKNEKSVSTIQSLIQKEKQAVGSVSAVDLSNLLSQMVGLKTDFDKRLLTLEKNIAEMPNSLADLDDWINKQQLLIKKENEIRRQIQQMETANTVDIYTRRLQMHASSNLQEIQEIRTRADNYIAYKKTIALWLGIWPDQKENLNYLQESPKPATDRPFKGYSISFPVFEELSNPSFLRDWITLPKITQFSDALRSSIFANLIDPTKSFITTNTSYYTSADNMTSIPAVDTLSEKSVTELETIVSAAKKTMDEFTATAITIEMQLNPVFDSYKKIRSDIRTEFQPILQEQASTILSIWTDIAGKSTAIQTNLQILQPYASPEQITQSAAIVSSCDQAVSADIIQKVQMIQQTTKLPGFLTTIAYMDMIRLYGDRTNINKTLITIESNFEPIQQNFNSLQSEVLINFKANIETARANLSANLQAAFVNKPNSSSVIQETLQPKANGLISKQLNTISECIEVNNGITALNTQIQALV